MDNRSGWVKGTKCGCVGKARNWKYADLRMACDQLLEDAVLAYPIENFGRFNHDSKLTILAIALALYDAGIAYAKDKKQDISILGANNCGALDANLAYFNDYIANGRTLARGNLFIYTLPSSPLAEAAIHFGLTGKLLYLGFAKNIEGESLKYALDMLKTQTSKTIILVNADSKAATCHILQKSS